MNTIFRYLLSFVLVSTWTLTSLATGSDKISRACVSSLIIEAASAKTVIPQVKGLDIDYKGLVKENGELNTKHQEYQKLVDHFSALQNNYEIKSFFKARNVLMDEMFLDGNHNPKPYLISYTRSRGADIKNRLAVMRYAKHNIISTYFIFFNDHAGQLFMKEIKYALSRGVDVNLQVNWALIAGMASKAVTPRLGAVLRNPLKLFKVLSPSAWNEFFADINDPYATNKGGLKALQDWYNQEIKSKNIGDTITDPATGQTFVIKGNVNPLTGEVRKANLNLFWFNPQRIGHWIGNLGRLYARFTVASINVTRSLVGLEPLKQIEYNNVLDNQSHDKGVYADINFPGRAVGQIGGSNIEDLYYADHHEYTLDNHEDQGMLIWSIPPSQGVKASDNPFNDLAIWYQALINVRGNDRIKGSMIAMINSIFGANSWRTNKLAEQSKKEAKAPSWLEMVTKKINKAVGRDAYVEEDAESKLELYNEDGSINTAADDQALDYLANKKNIGVADGDLTHNLQNFGEINAHSLMTNRQYRRSLKNSNANSTMKQYYESIFAHPEKTQEIRIGKAYMHLEKDFIKRLRKHLADHPHIKLVFHFNSVLSNDQLATQQLFERDVLPQLTSQKPVINSRGEVVDVSDNIKVYLEGRINDRRVTLSDTDYKTGLFHFKGTLVRRDGEYEALEDIVINNDPRSVMEIGTHNLDGRSKWINSEVTWFFRKGTLNSQLAHFPEADPAAEIGRYMVERLEKRGHLYGSKEYFDIHMAVLEAPADHPYITPAMKAVSYVSPGIVDAYIAKNGPLSAGQKLAKAKAFALYAVKEKLRVLF